MSREQTGASLIELLVALGLFLFVLLAVLTAYTQGNTLSAGAQSQSDLQANAQLAMNRLENELRMVGFGVPSGPLVGGATLWTPSIFHATATEVRFRAEMDAGSAEVTCTPRTANTDCPRDSIRLDSVRYFDSLACKKPDDPLTQLAVVVIDQDESWQPVSCTSVDTGESSIAVNPDVTDNTFVAGLSKVRTIEHVYYRYVPGAAPEHGVLERSIRYVNQPDLVVPGSSSWDVLARHVTSFSFTYLDESGAVLGTMPLSAADRAAVRRIGISLEVEDPVGAHATQRVEVDSEILVRNVPSS